MKRIALNIATIVLAIAFIYYCEEVRDAIRHAGQAKRAATLFAALPLAPLKVVMQSVDGSTRTCPAQYQSFDLVDGVSVLTIAGLACTPDSIFKNGFEP